MAAQARLAIELLSSANIVKNRDTEIDQLKAAVESLRDELVTKATALAGTEQALRSATAELQLKDAKLQRVELSLAQQAQRHAAELQAAEDERRQALQLLAAQRDAVEATLRLQLQGQADGAERLRAERDMLAGECRQAQDELARSCRRVEDLAREVAEAQRAVAEVEKAAALAREDTSKALLLRDERISDLNAQLQSLARADGARLSQRDAEAGVWRDRCNALVAACERATAELDAARRAERRAAAALGDAERRVREAQEASAGLREQVATLQAELRQQLARSSAAEMELRQAQRRLVQLQGQAHGQAQGQRQGPGQHGGEGGGGAGGWPRWQQDACGGSVGPGGWGLAADARGTWGAAGSGLRQGGGGGLEQGGGGWVDSEATSRAERALRRLQGVSTSLRSSAWGSPARPGTGAHRPAHMTP